MENKIKITDNGTTLEVGYPGYGLKFIRRGPFGPKFSQNEELILALAEELNKLRKTPEITVNQMFTVDGNKYMFVGSYAVGFVPQPTA